MMNEYDFYSIEVSSVSKRLLKKVGNFNNISESVDRSGRFPKSTYRATIGYVDVKTPNSKEIVDDIVKSIVKVDGVNICVRYWTRD